MKRLLLAFCLALIGLFCMSQEFNYYELENLINRDYNQGIYICNVKGFRSVGQTYEGLSAPDSVISYYYEQVNTTGNITGVIQLIFYKSDPDNVGGVHIFSKTPGTYADVIKEAQRLGMQKSDEQSNNDTISGIYQDKNIYIYFSNNKSEAAKYSYVIYFERKLD